MLCKVAHIIAGLHVGDAQEVVNRFILFRRNKYGRICFRILRSSPQSFYSVLDLGGFEDKLPERIVEIIFGLLPLITN